MPTFGSLFAGIGGIDLGLERAGWTGRWQVEYEPFCQRVLAKHWPDVTRYGDIHDVDWSTVERVDLVAGGFPCQPFSNAGKRLGKDDDRWLWPEFARAIGNLRPRYVLVENVPGLLAGHGGMGAVLGDLAALGYDAEWDSIPASAVGAPHLRYRVWIVAYPNGVGQRRDAEVGPSGLARARPEGAGPEPHGAGAGTLADANSLRRNGGTGLGWTIGRTEPADSGAVPDSDRRRRQGERVGGLQHRERAALGDDADGRYRAVPHTNGRHAQGVIAERDDPQDRQESPFGPAGLFGGAGADRGWPPEPDVGRVAHGVPARVDRLRSLGNAVVPQVVEFIGRRILEAEALT